MKVAHGNDMRTLECVASGLFLLQSDIIDQKELTLPYNAPLTHGINRLILNFIEKQQNPPVSLWDVTQLAHQAVKNWHLDVPEELMESILLEDGRLTEVCCELAFNDLDIQSELVGSEMMEEVLEISRRTEQPELYQKYKHFLDENPVIESFALQTLSMDLRSFKSILTQAYEKVPKVHCYQDQFWVCQTCGDLLEKHSEGWQCIHCGCVDITSQGMPLNTKDAVLRLKRGLRHYLFKPSSVVVKLAQKIEDLGLSVELWPHYGACDLCVKRFNGELWAVNVRDWASPYLLASHVSDLGAIPNVYEAAYIFPNERKTESYLEVFGQYSSLAKNTKIMFEGDFLKKLKK